MEVLAQLGIDPTVMIAQAVNFFILLGLLTFLVYKPVLRLLDERKGRIKKAEEHAQLIEDKLARTEEVSNKEIHCAQIKAQEIISEAKEVAKIQEEELIKIAKEKVSKVVEEGRQLIAKERDAAAAEIQAEVSKIVVLATEKLLGKEANTEEQSRLIAEATKELEKI